MTFAPVADGACVEETTADLLAAGIGDGLPVVPPTASRWEAMLDGVGDPDAVLAAVPPLFGELTARVAAGCCVLAGCRPGVLPVVLAAARAATEPEFNLLGVQTTTGTPAVGLVVHGPVADAIGLSSSTGLLGPGPHANGPVGRALALTLAVVGGVMPGVTTMATTAQPARYGCCLAEAPSSPYPGLAVRRGLEGDAVTVLSIGGTAEVLPRDDLDAPDDLLEPLADALAAPGRAAGVPGRLAASEQTLVLPPEVAARLARSFPSIGALQETLYTRGGERLGAPVAADPEAVVPVVAGGPGIKILHLPGWMGGSRRCTSCL
ncbi:hypothetical protein LQ327_14770 [Actinomycetospora endophytica]|uniref:Uncharacterized protein n=1 Tax=Actinomycetospora endophytica TaxID=2291215 RepID=A0ABS8PCB6_9PSEU|nr:hypothetical protein [Actinomycetospora endophytica]MCD2194634.1 hypothetical protein [Actinomycetospora endophytica]